MSNIWLAFITGLTSGGISCMAVQGGLLASSIAQQKEYEETSRGNWKFVSLFLTAKIITYTLLGFILGYVGSFIVFTPKTQGVLQLLIGIFLVGTAGYLLNIHPLFRYFAIKPPKFAYKLAKSEGKKNNFLAPVILGSLTVFMPCGVTQAMMAVALATGSPLLASAIMFAFTLGTSPVFFAFGMFAAQLFKKKLYSYIGASLIFIFGILALNSSMTLFGSPHTLKNYYAQASSIFDGEGEESSKIEASAGKMKQGKQEVTITVNNNGYETNVTQLKVNIPVKLTLETRNTRSCARAFVIPSLNISKVLPESGETMIEFTPTKKGRLTFSCSMGMYSGYWEII